MKVTPLILLCLVVVAVISSCSPANLYYKPLRQRPAGAWEGNSTAWGGYTETSLGKGKVKVEFETFNNPGPAFASYFVKVRAAELALARGHQTFWLKNKGTQRWSQRSNFSGYILPGYMESRSYIVSHCDHHCKKHCHEHDIVVYEDFWVPDEFVPPRTSINQLGKAEVIMSTTSKIGTQMNARNIIGHALSGGSGYGKPRLSRQTMQRYQAVAR